jgi:hypothetical protein
MEHIITGERIQQYCDLYLGIKDDFNFNPIIKNDNKKHFDLNLITTTFNNPYKIFCYGHQLYLLQQKLKYFINPFVLISHNSDENIDSKFESILNSNLLIKWFAQNILIFHPKLFLLPIGIANSMWKHGNLQLFKKKVLNKKKDFYFFFSINTNFKERIHCKEEIEKKGLIFGKLVNFDNYIKELSEHKFAICPPGNGIDSHRIWECYYLNTIPILLKNNFTLQLAKILPCVLLDKWSDLNLNIINDYDYYNNILNLNNHFLDINYYLKQINN